MKQTNFITTAVSKEPIHRIESKLLITKAELEHIIFLMSSQV